MELSEFSRNACEVFRRLPKSSVIGLHCLYRLLNEDTLASIMIARLFRVATHLSNPGGVCRNKIT